MSLKPISYLLIPVCLISAAGLFIACGKSPSGPESGPTPSVLTVELTGGDETCLRLEASTEEAVPAGVAPGRGCSDAGSECGVTATWTICPDNDFQSYALYRSTSPGIAADPENAELLITFTDADQRSFEDTTVVLGVTYHYAVRTGNTANEVAWSNEAEITTPGAPTPSVLTAVAGATEVALSWTQCPDADFSCYTLYRSYVAGIAEDTLSAEKLGVFTDPDMLSFNDSTIAQPTAYYALRTTNAAGLSVWSNEETAVLLGCTIIAWGRNDEEQCNVPYPNRDFTAVAGGLYHSLGLRDDGSIAAWGSNTVGQCMVPAPNTGFTAVSAGGGHSLGLRNDGSITAWGKNDAHQCDVPSPNTGFTAVSAGGLHSLGLREDGSIAAWGRNDELQCDVPSPNTGFIAIAAGAQHSLGLRNDGSIAAWGRNIEGQCDIPDPNTSFIAVAAGGHHSLGLKSDGSIVAWGFNNQGQCTVPDPNSGFVAVAGGFGHSLGLKSNGSIVAWGWNEYGQSDVPSPNSGYTAVSAGGGHSLGLREE
ncbi:MAG: Regulator of chromosome condensation (RCC1) repeat protein [Candidatus Latescibacteria bacterium ADurb.Bin168]|nr:MAG: Regulator of chromosome condensation (RCC1) repeat protein [Candidatus Latescibacteria bacterium ADurb.Bin168]